MVKSDSSLLSKNTMKLKTKLPKTKIPKKTIPKAKKTIPKTKKSKSSKKSRKAITTSPTSRPSTSSSSRPSALLQYSPCSTVALPGECASGFECAPGATGNYCLKLCTSDADCTSYMGRSGFICETPGYVSICFNMDILFNYYLWS